MSSASHDPAADGGDPWQAAFRSAQAPRRPSPNPGPRHAAPDDEQAARAAVWEALFAGPAPAEPDAAVAARPRRTSLRFARGTA